MKDLKHLYYFEKLLDEANNEPGPQGAGGGESMRG